MKKINKQALAIIALIILFISFDIGFYNLITKRFINNYGEEMQEKSIKLKEYLPFDENSKIVKKQSNLKIEGKIPVIDGATALYPIYSAFVNSIYPEESIEFDGKEFAKTSAIQKQGTPKAYKAIVDGTADIIFCAQPSKEQLEYAKSKNIELELVPIGKEAFVFIVNSKNEISNLTIEQIKGIYKGKYKNWKELGGQNSKIISLQRAER